MIAVTWLTLSAASARSVSDCMLFFASCENSAALNMWCKKVTKQFALITPQPQTTKMFRSLRSFKLSVLMSRSPQCRGLAFVYCSENATTSTTIYFHCSATNTSSLLYIQLKINMWLHFSLVMIISLALMLMTSVNELTTLHTTIAPLSLAQNNQKPPKYCRNKFLVTESLDIFFIYVNYHVLLRSRPSIHMRNSVRLSPMTTGPVSRVTISAHIFRSSPVWTDSRSM